MRDFYDVAYFTPERSIGFLLHNVSRSVGRRFDAIFGDGEGPSYTQWQVLISLHFGLGGTTTSLSRHLEHDGGAMTRLVAGLERRGWLHRRRRQVDRRVVDLILTESGSGAAIRGLKLVAASWNGWLAGWDDSEVEALIANLRILRERVQSGSLP